MVALAVLRQHVANVEVRELQHIAEILLILIAIQSAQGSPTVGDHFRVISVIDRSGESVHKLCALLLSYVFRFGRHFPLTDTVMNKNPSLSDSLILEVKRQRSKIKIALRAVLIVALETRLIDERSQLPGDVCVGRNNCHQKSSDVKGCVQ